MPSQTTLDRYAAELKKYVLRDTLDTLCALDLALDEALAQGVITKTECDDLNDLLDREDRLYVAHERMFDRA